MKTVWLNQRREQRAKHESAAADYEIGALIELPDLMDILRITG